MRSGMSDIYDHLAALLGMQASAIVKIRKTNESHPQISIFDVIAIIKKEGVRNAGRSFYSVVRDHPDIETACKWVQFPGRGQKKTPVINAVGIVKIIMALPSICDSSVASVRREAAKLFVQHLDQDPQLVDKIWLDHDEIDPKSEFSCDTDCLSQSCPPQIVAEAELSCKGIAIPTQSAASSSSRPLKGGLELASTLALESGLEPEDAAKFLKCLGDEAAAELRKGHQFRVGDVAILRMKRTPAKPYRQRMYKGEKRVRSLLKMFAHILFRALARAVWM